ncbi:MAG: hypothetical protein HeimC3_46930 [Candidatus Heimdallarchaeota archaeon LC_3]|nr:MAG: hypothetical protein HeimC3_46930 [Candidatus Heimdallarchaeota archaeon LC_3]
MKILKETFEDFKDFEDLEDLEDIEVSSFLNSISDLLFFFVVIIVSLFIASQFSRLLGAVIIFGYFLLYIAYIVYKALKKGKK